MSPAANGAGLIPVRDQDKIKTTVYASAAMVGLEVYELADGSFIVSRWGFIRPVADLAGVMRMVRQMGGCI